MSPSAPINARTECTWTVRLTNMCWWIRPSPCAYRTVWTRCNPKTGVMKKPERRRRGTPGKKPSVIAEARALEPVQLSHLAGVRQAKQGRSRAKHDSLLAAGLRLLETESFHGMTVGRIASEAGCSVGTFYARFADKDAFLTAVQEYLYWRQ